MTLAHWDLPSRRITRRQYVGLIKLLGLDPNKAMRIVLDADEVTIEYPGATVKIHVEEPTPQEIEELWNEPSTERTDR